MRILLDKTLNSDFCTDDDLNFILQIENTQVIKKNKK